MNVLGVIAEYDPFHRGHERLFHLAKERTGAEKIVCVMSGSFTQRGTPALLPAPVRAEMALRGGADVVLQLPYAFSVREAEFFALGGVQVLSALGCVTHLAFGCEGEDTEALQNAARLLENPDKKFNVLLRRHLEKGFAYADAATAALCDSLHVPPETLRGPNNVLAIHYLRALERLHSPMVPIPIQRNGDYHEKEVEASPSASAVRAAILRGDWQAVKSAVPERCLPPLERAVAEKQLCRPENMDTLLRYRLMQMDAQGISALPGVEEGLENRILKAAQTARGREELISLVKTRRYTYGRISRALCHAVMQVEKKDLPVLPACARVLGFRRSAAPLLRILQEGALPLVTRPAREREKDMALDLRADACWAICAGQERGDTYRRAPVILQDE